MVGVGGGVAQGLVEPGRFDPQSLSQDDRLTKREGVEGGDDLNEDLQPPAAFGLTKVMLPLGYFSALLPSAGIIRNTNINIRRTTGTDVRFIANRFIDNLLFVLVLLRLR